MSILAATTQRHGYRKWSDGSTGLSRPSSSRPLEGARCCGRLCDPVRRGGGPPGHAASPSFAQLAHQLLLRREFLANRMQSTPAAAAPVLPISSQATGVHPKPPSSGPLPVLGRATTPGAEGAGAI